MAKGIGDGEEGDQSANREVPPVSPDHAFATDDKRQNGKKAGMIARGPAEPDSRRSQKRATSRYSEKKKHDQGRITDRQPTGPVRHGGERKARDDGRCIAEDHLVLVPDPGIQRRRQCHQTTACPGPRCLRHGRPRTTSGIPFDSKGMGLRTQVIALI